MGNIVYVDYERSSWKFMNYECFDRYEDLDSFKIGGQTVLSHDTISVFIDIPSTKGGGSAFRGQWRPKPNKPADQRYVGTPGEGRATAMPNGDVFQTKIGPDGKAVMERHHIVHNRSDEHSNPHDHEIWWDTPDGHPNPQPPINYWDGDAPEFKHYRGGNQMGQILYIPTERCHHTSHSGGKNDSVCFMRHL